MAISLYPHISTVPANAGERARLFVRERVFTPAIRKALRSTILEFDPVGRTWGIEDLWRAPDQNTRWGWNATFVSQIKAPTLIILGDLDTQADVAVSRNLYNDLVMDSKAFVHVACAAHQLVWENRHMTLLRASGRVAPPRDVRRTPYWIFSD